MSTDTSQMGSDDSREVFAPSAMDEFPLKDLTETVIGAAFEVHNQLGSGFGYCDYLPRQRVRKVDGVTRNSHR
jgi:hypothetical protein